jgi:hypothetical protein
LKILALLRPAHAIWTPQNRDGRRGRHRRINLNLVWQHQHRFAAMRLVHHHAAVALFISGVRELVAFPGRVAWLAPGTRAVDGGAMDRQPSAQFANRARLLFGNAAIRLWPDVQQQLAVLADHIGEEVNLKTAVDSPPSPISQVLTGTYAGLAYSPDG